MDKMLLGTYRLSDSQGTELASLIHGNRLIKAYISDKDKLMENWVSPNARSLLEKRGVTNHPTLVLATPETTAILDRAIQDGYHKENHPDPPQDSTSQAQEPTSQAQTSPIQIQETAVTAAQSTNPQTPKQLQPRITIKLPLKRIREEAAALEEVLRPKRRKITTTPSSSFSRAKKPR